MGAKVRRLHSYVLLTAMSALLMGNESCEQAQDKTRVLKLEIELGQLRARPIALPNGEMTDFPSVARELFLGQVIGSRHFVIANPVPAPTLQTSNIQRFDSSAAASTSRASSRASMDDVRLLENFGFQWNKPAPSLHSLSDRGSVSRDLREFGPAVSTTGERSAAACVTSSAQALLTGDVLSFEALSRGGLRVGYGTDGRQLGTGFNGALRFSSSRLDIRVRTDDPLSRQAIVLGDGVASQNTVDFSFSFAPGIPIGVDFFQKTALADVIRRAVDRSLEQLVASYTRRAETGNWKDVWESRTIYDSVIADNDTYIALRGGVRANVRAGDRFHLTNLRHVWEGAPCSSRLLYRVPLTERPGALVEVVTVGDNVSVAKVLEYFEDEAISPGAMVRIESLKEEREAPQAPQRSQQTRR